VTEDTRLPALDTKPPLLREHRLYQADWLLRFYEFKAEELLDRDNPNFKPLSGPQVQLGGAALRAVPGGREPRPL